MSNDNQNIFVYCSTILIYNETSLDNINRKRYKNLNLTNFMR
ncbi:unnamed protein product [Brugia timori]|uniref:Kinesin motor domain-containing protein n=1 Tax=Brugia timori TaxID=42155 RepID=A0A0R3RDK4_9BILA|nr:unnamed protein product [Brugia timori]